MSYKLTAVYAPGSIAFLALAFIALSIFKSASLFESFGFVAVALLSFWVAALFFEVVSFEVDSEDGSVCLNKYERIPHPLA